MAKRGFRPEDAPPAEDRRAIRTCRPMADGWRSRSPRPTRRRTGCARRSGWRRSTARRPRAGSARAPRTGARAGLRTAVGSPTSRCTDDQPEHAHVRLAPLDGGVPTRLGDLPGPVSQLAWSPDSTRIVVVCRVGAPDRAKASAAERNAPRVVRGLAARLDGVGWQDGRRHLFVVDVEGRLGPPADPGRVRPRRPLVLARRRHDRVRLRPPPPPRRSPVPRGRVGRARRRRPAAPPHERQGPRRLPGVLSRRQDDRVRGQETDDWDDRHPRVRRPRRRQRRGRAGRARTSIARPSCSRVFPRRCAGPATASSLMLVADRGSVTSAPGAASATGGAARSSAAT